MTKTNWINILLFALLGFCTGIFGLAFWQIIVIAVITSFIQLNSEDGK